MKTLITLLTLALILNLQTLAQRNSGGNRNPIGDRIDKINDGNPVRNPDNQRQPIQPPVRIKDNPQIVLNLPGPEIHQPICHPHPPIPVCGPPPERPPHNPHPPIIIDNEPNLDELPLSEVLDLGIIKLDSELYNEAIKCFNILLKDDPLDYEIYTLRGRAYHGLELFDRAKKDFQKSIKINKSFADGYYYLGLTEISMDNIDEAIVDFEIAAELGNDKAKQLIKKYFSQ